MKIGLIVRVGGVEGDVYTIRKALYGFILSELVHGQSSAEATIWNMFVVLTVTELDSVQTALSKMVLNEALLSALLSTSRQLLVAPVLEL